MNPVPPRRVVSQTADLPYFLRYLARRPVEAMKMPLQLTWPAILSLQIGCALFSGALAGLATFNAWDFFGGVLIFPLTSFAGAFVYSGFIYSYFSLFRSTYLDYRKLHSIVAISLTPYFFVHVFSGFVPPFDLLGFALSALLLIVGLVEQFALPRKIVINLAGVLAVLFFLSWMFAQIYNDGGGPASTG